MTFVVAALALFGAGLTATLSPCVLPLVPGYLGVLADGRDGARAIVSRVTVFAAGAACTFAVLGGVAGVIGSGVGDAGSWAQRIAGGLLLVFSGVAVAGRLGRASWSVHLSNRLSPAPAWRAFVLGVGCGVAWTPCTGPLLGAALTAAAGASSVARSTVLLLWYAAGVLAPFVALAAFGAARAAAWLRRWSRVLGPLSATVMAGLGLVLVLGWYDGLVSRLAVG
ncbi:MAG: sulfite exporter TauE/SafE family protein [Actinobacteria bacterium]|nr:sulfite exporter TauE/SafE family protein [Actinomycetota bacterium]